MVTTEELRAAIARRNAVQQPEKPALSPEGLPIDEKTKQALDALRQGYINNYSTQLQQTQAAGGGNEPLWRKALGVADTVLDFPLKEVARPAMGALTKALAHEGPLAKATGVHLTSMTEEEQKRVLEAESYTQAYRERMQNKPGWQKFVVEAAADPYNLVGVGLPAKVRTAARARGLVKAGSAGDKVLGTARTLDERAAQAFAFPITGPAWLVGQVGKRTGVGKRIGGWFEESKRGQLFTGLRKVKQTFSRLGADEAMRGGAGAVTRADDEAITRALFGTDENGMATLNDGYEEVINNLTDYELVRQFEANTELFKNFRELYKPLVDRGLIDTSTGLIKIAPQVHTEMNRALRNAGINASERDVMSLLIDMVADGLPRGQTWGDTVYTSPEEVLSRMEFFNVDGPTTISRDGGTVKIGVGNDATTEQIAAGIFEHFVGPGMNMSDRARLLMQADPTRPTTAPYTPEDWNGIGARVINMIRQTDVTTDDALQNLFNQFRSITRLSPMGEGLPNAAAETVIDTLSPETIGGRRRVATPDERVGQPGTVQQLQRQLGGSVNPPRTRDDILQEYNDVQQEWDRLVNENAPYTLQRPLNDRAGELIDEMAQVDAAAAQRMRMEQAQMPRGPENPPATQMELGIEAEARPPQTPSPLGLSSDASVGSGGLLDAVEPPPPFDASAPRDTFQDGPMPGDPIQGPFEPQTRRLLSQDINAQDTPQGFQRRFGPEAPGQEQIPLTELAADAPFEQYVARVADKHGMQPEQFEPVRERLAPAIERNPEYFQSGALAYNDAFEENLLKAVQDPSKANVYLEEAMEAINLPMAASMFRSPFLYKVRLPGVKNLKEAPQATVFGKITDRQLREDREYAEKVLSNPIVQKELKEVHEKMKLVDAALEELRRKVPLSPNIDNVTFRQLLSDPNILKHLDKDAKKLIEEAVDAVGLSGTALRNERYTKAAFDAWEKALKKDLGIRDLPPNAFGREFNRATRAWREQLLLTPRYHITNALDMAVKSLVYGVGGLNPIGLRDNAQQQAVRWGFNQLPESLKTRSLQEISERTGQIEPGRHGSQSATGQYVGMVSDRAGAAVDRVMNANHSLAAGLEDTARTAAWIHGIRQYLTDSFHSRFLNYTASRARAAGMSEDATKALVKELRTQGVHYGPDDVRAWVVNNGGSNELASDIASMWKSGLDEGSQYGENLANKIHFQIGDERNIEAALKLRHILPFHTWATRNIPFYLQTLAANPWIYRTINHYNNANEDEMEMLGLTSRFRSKMLVPEKLNGVFSLLMGPGHHAYNPMIAFSIADQFKGGYEPDYSESSIPLVGKTLGKLSKAGFRPAPWVDIPLNIAGIYGTEEAFGLSRHGDTISDAVEAATGSDILDLEPTSRFTTAARNKLSPITGVAKVDTVSNSTFMDRAINLELREMAERETGDAQNVEYQLAGLDPENPLYKKARATVVNRDLRRGVQSMVSPFPYTSATPQGMDAMQAAPPASDKFLNFLLREWNHPSTRFNNVPSDRTTAEINAGFDLGDAVGKEQRDVLVAQLGLQGFNDYIAWLQTVPRGRDRSVRTYLEERRY